MASGYGRDRLWWKLQPTAGATMTAMMFVCFASFVALGVFRFLAIAVADAEGPPRIRLRSLLLALNLAAIAIGLITAFVRTKAAA